MRMHGADSNSRLVLILLIRWPEVHVVAPDGGEGRVRRLADVLEVPVLVQLRRVARILHPLPAQAVVHLQAYTQAQRKPNGSQWPYATDIQGSCTLEMRVRMGWRYSWRQVSTVVSCGVGVVAGHQTMRDNGSRRRQLSSYQQRSCTLVPTEEMRTSGGARMPRFSAMSCSHLSSALPVLYTCIVSGQAHWRRHAGHATPESDQQNLTTCINAAFSKHTKDVTLRALNVVFDSAQADESYNIGCRLRSSLLPVPHQA